MEQVKVLELALEALQKQKMAVEEEIRQLTADLGRGQFAPPPITARARRLRKSGPQSAAARKAVSVRMKAYWVKRRAEAAKVTHRKMSAAAKKAISQKMKAAWARRKAAGKKS